MSCAARHSSRSDSSEDKSVTIGQSLDVAIKYLRANPQDLHFPFVLLAHRALATAFPCGDSGKASAKQR